VRVASKSDDVPEAQRIARWRAAAPVFMSPSTDFRLSLPISARNGCMRAGSPEEEGLL
jgi:hypothetical protein